MGLLNRTVTVLLLAALSLTFVASSALGSDRQGQVPLLNFTPLSFFDRYPLAGHPGCARLSGMAFGICNAFCVDLNCTVRSQLACEVLRWKFERFAGRSVFPCEDEGPPPATPTATATATDTVGVPTATATATATVTETAVPATATDTATATPTDTIAATVTDTPAATPTDTMAVPTGTVTATVTPTPTDSEATPTETAAEATPTDTAVEATSTATATAPSTPTPSGTPTATDTPGEACPLAAGSYTITQVEGGSLQVDGLPAFAFPAGGAIIQDVGAASGPDCVHETVVPFPGGFEAPTFCITALGFTVSVVQSGCGIGQIDSNGGADYTVSELGDTSSPTICSLPHAGCSNGADAAVQVDVTVGDGTPDSCATGTANAIVSIPVVTTTWADPAFECPDADGTFDASDTLIVQFPQILDFTTDTASADWSDLDPDGCCIAGAGPGSFTNPCNAGGPGGFSNSGECLDLVGGTITTAASGTIGSSGSPLYDLTFTTELPNSISGPAPLLGATCDSPPAIDFNGTTTRCITESSEALDAGRPLRQRQRGLRLFSPESFSRRR